MVVGLAVAQKFVLRPIFCLFHFWLLLLRHEKSLTLLKKSFDRKLVYETDALVNDMLLVCSLFFYQDSDERLLFTGQTNGISRIVWSCGFCTIVRT